MTARGLGISLPEIHGVLYSAGVDIRNEWIRF